MGSQTAFIAVHGPVGPCKLRNVYHPCTGWLLVALVVAEVRWGGASTRYLSWNFAVCGRVLLHSDLLLRRGSQQSMAFAKICWFQLDASSQRTGCLGEN